jgi:hypothetical protein
MLFDGMDSFVESDIFLPPFLRIGCHGTRYDSGLGNSPSISKLCGPD